MAYLPQNIVSIVSTVPSSVLVGASVIGLTPVAVTNIPSISGTVNVNPSSVLVLNPVSVLAVNPNPASVQVLNPVSLLAVSQSGVPWANTNVGSVITVGQGSIAVNIIAGSVAVATGNSSVQVLNPVSLLSVTQGTDPWTVKSSLAGGIFPVSGSVAATITNTNVNVSGSVVAFLGNSTNASVITVGTAAANQSVSGTVQTDVRASVAVVIIGGSILTSSTANQSVSGTVGASIIGTVPTTQSGARTTSVIGTYPDSFVASTVTGIPIMFKANVSSSIMQAVSPTFPLPVVGSVSGSVGIVGNPSISGTVATTQQGTWISSVVNTVPSSMLVGASIIGLTPISGNVGQTGTAVTSVINSTPSSLLAGVSIFGQLPAGTAPLGSVAVLQGTNPWQVTTNGTSVISVFKSSSVIAVVTGSVVALQGGTLITSVMGAIAPTGTVTSIVTAASTTNLLASNSGRRGATVSNYSGTSVLVKLGLMRNSNDHTVIMNNTDYYEVPFNYSGVVQYFSSSVAGFIKVTEIT